MRDTSGRFERRIAAVLLGCAAGAGVIWLYSAASRAAQRARYEAQRNSIHELVREHAREAPSATPTATPTETATATPTETIDRASPSDPTNLTPSPSTHVDPRTPEERPWYLSPEVAQELFRRDSSLETYDPWCYFRHKTGKNLHVSWAEHPEGGWNWVTNSLGLREDRELSPTPPDLRVLVTGDSHTDGFCDNSQSFPHVAEAELAGKQAGRRIEFINAGNGGFSFHNYLGVLARFVGLAPDAFVVAVYAGNDFVEVLVPQAYFRRQPLPKETPEQREEQRRATRISGPAAVQAFYEVVHFRQHPEVVEQSLRGALNVVSEMRAICDAHEIRMLVLLIPSAHQMSWGENEPLFERYVRELSLSKEDLAVTDRVSDDFLAQLGRAGVETLDAREIFRAETGPLYWKRDFHMNLRAHAAIGHALARRIESWGGKFAR